MSTREISQFTFNAIEASFASKHEKQRLEAIVNDAPKLLPGHSG
jgi:hypothetical protein